MRLAQNGDTIIEVLIAIAVVSSVLGSAYAITNRNVQNSQQSQEHSQALKVAEAQVEQFKSYAESNTALPASGDNFCMNINGSTNELVSFSSTGWSTGALPATDDKYPDPKCKKNDGTTITGRYMTGIKRTGNTYTVYVSWDGPTAHREQVSLVYKVYP